MTIYKQRCGCLLLDRRDYCREYNGYEPVESLGTFLRVIAPCDNPYHRVGTTDIEVSSTKKTKFSKLKAEEIGRIIKWKLLGKSFKKETVNGQ